MNPIKIFNTKSKSKEVFVPLNSSNVTIYSCGPTVYNFCHIGNFRTFIFTDLLRRTLKLFGYNLNHTMNITDIEDKIIKASSEKNLSTEEFTKPWIEAFFEDIKILNIEPVENYPKATESIDEMVFLIQKLKNNHLTYIKEDSVYFSIQAFNNYGQLSNIDSSQIKTGTRYDTDEYEKDDVRDFVLWKAPKEPSEKHWDTEIGKGRPGWHVECSAMIHKIYHSKIDIHTGGVDLIFPHHENEIAQSEGVFGTDSFTNYWMHCEHLLVDGEKMSKSKGNYYTLRDLLSKGYDSKSIRYLLLSQHYRSKLNFSLDKLKEVKNSIERIQTFVFRLLEFFPDLKNENYNFLPTFPQTNSFLEALADDLNLPLALNFVFESIREFNSSLDQNEVSQILAKDIFNYFKTIDKVLGILEFDSGYNSVLLDHEIEKKIEERQNARKNKDFKRSDEIRDELLSKGIVLEDTKTGVRWKKV